MRTVIKQEDNHDKRTAARYTGFQAACLAERLTRQLAACVASAGFYGQKEFCLRSARPFPTKTIHIRGENMTEARARPFRTITLQERLTQMEDELYLITNKLIELNDGIDGLYGAIRRFTTNGPRKAAPSVNRHATTQMLGARTKDNGNGQHKKGGNA